VTLVCSGMAAYWSVGSIDGVSGVAACVVRRTAVEVSDRVCCETSDRHKSAGCASDCCRSCCCRRTAWTMSTARTASSTTEVAAERLGRCNEKTSQLGVVKGRGRMLSAGPSQPFSACAVSFSKGILWILSLDSVLLGNYGLLCVRLVFG